MTKPIVYPEQLQSEAARQVSDNDISAPPAKTFLGIAYTALAGKPTTAMINHFMLNNEKAFDDLLMRL